MMDVYVVQHEYLRNDVQPIGVASTLEKARGMASEWLLLRYGYLTPRWPDHDNYGNGYRFWYTDVHGHNLVVIQFALDTLVHVEPAEDD